MLIALAVWTTPALTNPVSEQIATRVMELQDSEERWIEIDLTNQRLIAWEGRQPVYAIIVSTVDTPRPGRTGILASTG
ncbi:MULTISPECIES: L,D-transpeptidase [Moorena]|nr:MULTISPECIES: L,D-transpeptidase [Moorena]